MLLGKKINGPIQMLAGSEKHTLKTTSVISLKKKSLDF